MEFACSARFDSVVFSTNKLAKACPPVIPMRFRDKSRERMVGCPASAQRNKYAPSSPIRLEDRSSVRNMQGGVSSILDTWDAIISCAFVGVEKFGEGRLAV